jgi:hypothetical protein
MKSKKYIKGKIKTRKNKMRKNKSRKNKKGGFLNLWSRKKIIPSECDVNNLSMIKEPKDMQQNYLKCCPKTFFGKKNSSPYCKQLDLSYKNILSERNANAQFTGSSPEEIFKMRQQNNVFIDPLANTNYNNSTIKLPSYAQ